MEQLGKALGYRRRAKMASKQVPHIKLLEADLDLVPSAGYKSIPTVQKELLTEFEDIALNQIILEESVDTDAPNPE